MVVPLVHTWSFGKNSAALCLCLQYIEMIQRRGRLAQMHLVPREYHEPGWTGQYILKSQLDGFRLLNIMVRSIFGASCLVDRPKHGRR
jgi:hypothetical protein